MANGSRPTSMIIPPGVFDEPNTYGSRNVMYKNDSQTTRSSNQSKLPANPIINVHSSSSSIDSTGAKNTILYEKPSLPPINLPATVSSTTTDSEFESGEEEQDNDDNHSSEANHSLVPNQEQQQQQQQQHSSSRSDSGQGKTEFTTQEQSSRRVKHFRKLFKSELVDGMPELIDSYVCAYQGDILLQGKMYITNRYLCFHSRIISYVTKHVYRWEQIEHVSKERVAFIFPTAIGIQLKSGEKKIIYASFLQRDQAFDKIISICSRFNNDPNCFQDEEEGRFTPNRTLKAFNSNHTYNDRTTKSKRDPRYEIPDETEQDEVLQMCLGQDRTLTNHPKRRPHSVSSKSSDGKQQQPSKKLFNSDTNKLSSKTTTSDQMLPNGSIENISDNHQTNRSSHYSTNQTDITIRHRPSHTTSLRSHQTCNGERTSTSTNGTISNATHPNSTSNSMTHLDLSNSNSDDSGILRRYARNIVLSVISVIKLIIEYLIFLYNQFKTYPIKTSIILLIFIAVLIFHSFYLIKLIYRIESRLQALNHMWPSSSLSRRNSLPS